MNVRLAYPADFGSFKTLFPEIKLFDFEDKTPIDLLVFSGGEDVSLEYYLPEPLIAKYKHLCMTNKNRDEYERKVLFSSLNGEYEVNKILGVCRGTQFLNVMFGGQLYPDINSAGIVHGGQHPLIHVANTNLEFLKIVNSLHHQGISVPGDYIKELNLKTRPQTIAVDQIGKVREIVSWLREKVLGVQFHPEYYNDNFEDKIKFREFIYSWVRGEKSIFVG